MVKDEDIVRERLRRNLAYYLGRSGLTHVQLAERVGVTKQAVGQWLRKGKIGTKRLPDIAEALGISTDQLLEPATGSLNEPPAQYTHQLLPAKQRTVPLRDWRLLGSTPTEESGARPMTHVPAPAQLSGPNAYALTVDGDAMTGEIPAGSTIYVDPDIAPTPGDLVVALPAPGASAVLRRLTLDGGQHVLTAENPRYPALACHQVLGVVVGAYRWLR